MERFEAPSTRTLRRISVHSSMSVRTLLPFCSSARARSLEAGPSRSGDAQVLPFWTVIPTRSGAAVFDRDLQGGGQKRLSARTAKELTLFKPRSATISSATTPHEPTPKHRVADARAWRRV